MQAYTSMPDNVRAYIGRIRNARKRNYADGYARYLMGWVDEPIRDDDLSYMAAQAVRIELHDMIGAR